MLDWLKLMWQTSKVFLAFSVCTLMFYFGLQWLNREYENYHRYDEPNGRAVKVFNQTSETEGHLLERLKFFYQSGE
ncbi:YqzK family protein [Fictibacillus iocasae]|uniref:YqzK family protein n=1 Tax=Fictibacillus iocasae TaxID=2715437 RepID=A0ABW2NKH8_9BACL